MPNPYYQVTVTCAVCGKLKGIANHWWKAQEWPGLQSIEFWPLTELPPTDDQEPICGQECAHKMLDQFMSSFPRASATPRDESSIAGASNPAVDADETQQPEPLKFKSRFTETHPDRLTNDVN